MRTVLIAMLLALSGNALASIDGVFFDPAFAGEGWTFESQNDRVGGTWYTYESNGQPTFRTLVGTITYTVNSASPELTVNMTGQVFRTENRTNSTQVGTFTATFRTQGIEQTATITAAGVTRNLRRFDFAFGSPLDKVRGIWVVSTLSATDGTAVTLIFKGTTDTVNFTNLGPTPVRRFVTYDGFSGIVFINPSSGLFQAQVDFGTTGTYVASVAAGDEGGVGFGALFSPSGTQIGPTEGVVATDIANTEGETPALRQVLAGIGVTLPSPPPTGKADVPEREYTAYTLKPLAISDAAN